MDEVSINEKHEGNSVIVSIFATHAQRIGFARTAFSAVLMYTTFPLFVFLHISVTVVLYALLIRPLLRTDRFDPKKYIVLDRFDLTQLSLLDRINCLFCEYANGVVVLFNTEIDAVATHAKASLISTIIIYLYVIPLTLFTFLGMCIFTIPTYFIVRCTGLHRASYTKIIASMNVNGYAGTHMFINKAFIRFYKLFGALLAYNLEQIESAWCPIRHIQKNREVFPEHHKNFFERNDLWRMKERLLSVGSVSDNPPKF